MLIVEKIRKDYSTKTAIIYCKNTSVIYTSDIPVYPANTVLDWDKNGILRVIDYFGKNEETKKLTFVMDAFYQATKDILTPRQFEDAIERFGVNCMDRFYENPFFLLDVSFKEAPVHFPEIDKNIRIRTFEMRLIEIREAVKYIIEWSANRGNTWISYAELENMVIRLLKADGHPLTKEEGSLACYLNYWKDVFYFDIEHFYRRAPVTTQERYRDEKNIYDIVRNFVGTASPYADFSPDYVDRLSPNQNDAIRNLLTSGGHFSILTGGPGTGKTTILQALVDAFIGQYPNDGVQLVSPTGKAAKRIREVMTNPALNISTIHKFLGYDAEGHKTTAHYADEFKAAIARTKLLIIDEASMTDIEIFKDLLALVPLQDMKIILVGDTDQLPSVGAGDLLRDLMGMGVYTQRLTESFRFVGSIAQNAARINQNNTQLLQDDDFEIRTLTEDTMIGQIYLTNADLFIAPYKKDGHLGSTAVINPICQNKLNGSSPRLGDTRFRLNDDIIFNRTNYACHYYNGEMGKITAYNEATGEYTIRIDKREIQTFAKDDIDLGYAITIHKSQGSEYEHVCIVLPEYSPFVTKRMLYTAVTRAKSKVTILTTAGTLEQIIKNNVDLNRKTIIRELTEGHIK